MLATFHHLTNTWKQLKEERLALVRGLRVCGWLPPLVPGAPHHGGRRAGGGQSHSLRGAGSSSHSAMDLPELMNEAEPSGATHSKPCFTGDQGFHLSWGVTSHPNRNRWFEMFPSISIADCSLPFHPLNHLSQNENWCSDEVQFINVSFYGWCFWYHT